MSNRFNIYDEYREKFYRLPKVFFTNEKYIKLSNDTKMAWAILQDRLELSRKNNWIDNNGDYFFIYTNEKLELILNCGHSKLNTIKNELTNSGLLEQERQGQGRPNILYLNKPEVTEKDIYAIDENEKTEPEVSHGKDFRKTEIKTSGKQKSRLPENRILDFRKTDTNDTDLSNTDLSDKEEEIKKAHKETILYQLLNDYLKSKEINQNTIDEIITGLHKEEIKFFLMSDVRNQFTFMMEKLKNREVYNHNNFALYFINGLEMRCNQSKASKKYQEEKQQEYEEIIAARNNKDISIYFNWLETAQ